MSEITGRNLHCPTHFPTRDEAMVMPPFTSVDQMADALGWHRGRLFDQIRRHPEHSDCAKLFGGGWSWEARSFYWAAAHWPRVDAPIEWRQ